MTLFDESHKLVHKRRVGDRNEHAWGKLDDNEEETAYEYRLAGDHARMRLDILGFDEARVRQTFEQRIADYIRRLESEDGYVAGLPIDGEVGDRQASAEFLRSYAFASWYDTIKKYIEPSFSRPWRDYTALKKLDPVMQLVCEQDHEPSEDFFYGYPSHDFRLFVRAVLMACGSEDPLILDYTELVLAGYYDGTEQLADAGKRLSSSELDATGKIIVLTEGKSDSRFLSRTMELLYPEAAPLYSFLDFGLPNLEGGAGNLVRILKGMIGAGISNRIVAIFDNDSAARDAMRSLEKVDIPSNVAVLSYPEIPYAESYPTKGPTGVQDMNANGLAGSIELYFGLDILEQADGTLTPVQWKGYIKSIDAYQGELLDKHRLQNSFDELLNRIHSPTSKSNRDWSGMEAILLSIFGAFRSERRDAIERQRELFSPWK